MNLCMTTYYKKHQKQCVNIMNDTWDFTSLFKGRTNINIANKIFFKFAILDANYTQVILDDEDNVHGYIFGKIKNMHQLSIIVLIRSISAFLIGCFHYIVGHFGNRKNAKQCLKEYINLEAELTSKRNKDDAYVSLFLVESSLRGFGYGKKLMNNFEDIALNHGCKRIYLWTDKGCNYKYYDHTGFKRVMEVSSPILKSYGEEPNGFAYVKPIN